MEMQKIIAAPAAPAFFDLFAVESGSVDHLGKKGRAATDREVLAYVHWLRRRAELPDHGKVTLNWQPIGRDRICVGATFGQELTGSAYPRPWSEGSYSVVMPGANLQRATVTMETLDEAGEIIASSTLPVEPKKGGVVWSREAVRKAHGPITKAKAKRGAALKAIETQETAAAPATLPETAEIVPSAPETGPERQSEAVSDITADILARLVTLEAALATLSAEPDLTPSVGIQATSAPAERPRRTPAHERTVRRAWQLRRERRIFRDAAEQATDQRAKLVEDLRSEGRRVEQLQARLLQRGQELDAAGQKAREQRRRVLQRARRVMASERQAAHGLRQRASRAEAELARLKADLADPSQPERASDIAQLVRERDASRNASAALQQRAERAEQARDQLADAVEGMASRLAVAEAAVRRLAQAA